LLVLLGLRRRRNAQKSLKQAQFLLTLAGFAQFSRFFSRFGLIFPLKNIIFERVVGVPLFWLKRKGARIILTYVSLWMLPPPTAGSHAQPAGAAAASDTLEKAVSEILINHQSSAALAMINDIRLYFKIYIDN
jgi:hypothetical protein